MVLCPAIHPWEERVGWELSKPFRNTTAFPRASAEPPLHHSRTATILLRSAGTANDQHTKSCKNPSFPADTCNTCMSNATNSPLKSWNSNDCWVVSLLSTPAPFSCLPAPALLMMPQRSVEPGKPHWKYEHLQGCAGLQSLKPQRFSLLRQHPGGCEAQLPTLLRKEQPHTLASLLPTRVPAIKQTVRAI